jgi:ankyrin repeat protein
MYAIEFDHESLVFWYASQSKKLNLKLDATDVEGYTALIRAVEKGEKAINIIKILLQFGADANILTLRRKTALKIACQYQYLSIVHLLMDYKVQRRNSAFNLLKEEFFTIIQTRMLQEEKKALEEAEKQQKEQEAKERMGWAEKSTRKNVYDAWVEYLDKRTKKPFYYNTVTRKSTFEKPKEFKPNKKRLVKEVIYGMHFYH